ncbi:sulfur oxidation c-type cytochrome SoxA [Thiohalophilus thiocyanatoxydans]|nr:sulfur oxidation c-type cytochrome SoxA [Thiohalophilus thiocyanatoxydans]
MQIVPFALLMIPGSLFALEPQSSYELLSEELKQMQDDDFANPGMATVDRGRELFQKPGFNGKSCASCHGDDGEKLDPERIAAYPIYDEEHGPVTLQSRINQCYAYHQEEFPLLYDADELIALETFVRHRARGEKMNVDVSGPMREHYEAGKEIFHTRIGQRDMACVHCHETYAGQRLRGQILNQAQINGFPIYRVTDGNIMSLHEKFIGCYGTLRAMPYEPGSQEYIDLEVYMSARGNGLPIETPGVRQ